MNTKTEAGHTPLPWKFHEQGDANEFCLVTSGGKWVLGIRQNGELLQGKQLANLIVKSVNEFPALLAERDRLAEELKLVWATRDYLRKEVL